MDAARGDHVPCLEFLLRTCGASLGAEDGLGRQAVHHAAQAGALGTLQFLLENGAEVNKTASVNSITPLHYAAKVCTV
jgi:ankyrin repeat protein